MTATPYRVNKVYQTTSVQTASQGKLIIMLFEGAVKFMNQFIAAVHRTRIEEAHENSLKAQRIMTELILALDHSKGGDVSRTIEAAYNDIRSRMAVANIRKDAETAKKVITDLESFRNTWNEVFKKIEWDTPPPPVHTGVSIKT